jgi:hypothetical protein
MGRKRGEDLSRGNEAKVVLNNDIYKESYKEVRKGLIELLLNTEYEEGEERDNIYMAIKALELVQTYMESVLTTGKFAERASN